MECSKVPRKAKWLYFVFNWNQPVACFSAAYMALAYCRIISKNWAKPFPNGSLRVVRFRPGGFPDTMDSIDREEITDVILRSLDI